MLGRAGRLAGTAADTARRVDQHADELDAVVGLAGRRRAAGQRCSRHTRHLEESPSLHCRSRE